MPTQRSPKQTIANAIILVGLVLLGGLTPVAAKDAVSEWPPMTLGFVRFFIAGLLFFVIYKLRHRNQSPQPIEKADFRRFAFCSFLAVPVNQYCFLNGTHLANDAHAGLFYALNPVLIFLIALIIGQTLWSRRMGIATLLAFGGAATVGIDGLTLGDKTLHGDILLFFCVLSFAMNSVLSMPLIRKYGTLRTMAIMMLLGSVLYSPGVLIDGRQIDFAAISWTGWAGLCYLTFVTSFLVYGLWFWAITRIDLHRVSIVVNAEPIVTVTGAYLWHATPISHWLIGGGVLLLAAIVLANWDKLGRLRKPPLTAPADSL